ncbi:unnamed protein product [Haemonchus placei]|uniref:Uncharacterized protein n=1 Tax=Haemonchus placei TaxID=6290 RepID=A0A0N4X647_HAEPC|nr:unnamed protein product [Haemonchus placei]
MIIRHPPTESAIPTPKLSAFSFRSLFLFDLLPLVGCSLSFTRNSTFPCVPSSFCSWSLIFE